MAIHKVDGVDGNNVFPRKFVRLHATDTSGTAGQVMEMNTGDTTNGAGMSMNICDAEDSVLAFGVASETWTVADGGAQPIRVQVAGHNSAITADSGAGVTLAALVGSGTGGGNGRIQDAAAWSQSAAPFGICVDALTASTADGAIFITDKGWYSMQ